MRTYFISLCALGIALSACKAPGSVRLEGRWRGTKVEGVDPGNQSAADAFASGTEIIARGNQIVVSTPAGMGRQATYFIDSEDKSTLVIRTDRDGETRETLTFGPDGRSLSWRVVAGKTMSFVKVN